MTGDGRAGDRRGPMIGRRIGVYDVQALLGAGGMGEVYRARDTRLGRDVAIKVLPAAFTTDRERLARFEREARLLATLNHPNIAAIYGLEEADGIRALVLELVEGQTLADRIGRQGLPLKEALALARQIVDALDAAHEKGIVHRDLKPANIKVSPDGVLKVLDFGLAKGQDEQPSADLSQSPTITVAGSRDGVILGTAAYMSPEQTRGRLADKRTDIWAFGCVLFEMLTGRRPFAGETISDTIGAILNHDPDWTRLPADTPPGVRRLLARCLDKDLRLRLRDIGDARSDLDAAAEPTTGLASAHVTTQSARVPWSIAALSILFAAGVAVWALMPHGADARHAPPRLSPAVRVTNTPAEEFGPAISPDGKWLAYYSNDGRRTDLIVKFLDSSATLNLTASLKLELPSKTGIGGLAISPDGTQIMFSARADPAFPQFDTWVMPGPVGGVPRKLLPSIPAASWSPDGTQIAYTAAGSTRGDALAVASSDGGNEHVLVDRQGGRHIHWSAWSRDGRFLYFIYTYDTWHTEPSEIYRVPAAGGAIEPVVRTVRRAVYPVPMPSGDLIFSANPHTQDLGLWWLRAGSNDSVPLTNGIGEHTEARLSADGRRLVATLLDPRQSLVSIPISGGLQAPQRLTDGFGRDLDPAVDTQSGRIVFSSARAGHRNLWIAAPDASGATPLTTEDASDERPSFSPDGQQIAFVSDRGGERGIWVISAQGGTPKLLARTIVLDVLSWSRDGQRIYFARPGGDMPALASVAANGGTIEPFTTPSDGAFSPVWSPAADVLAYLAPVTLKAPPPSTTTIARNFVRFVNAAGKPLFDDRPISANFPNGFLAWSPDGKHIAGVSNSANGAAEIWVLDPGSVEPARELVELPASVRPRGLTWSKDGTRIVYASQEFHGDIVLYDVNP